MFQKSAYILLICYFGFANAPLIGQEIEFETLAEKESVAYIVISDPNEFIKRVEESSFFDNAAFANAIKIVTDEEFGFCTPSDLENAYAYFQDLKNRITEMNEITVIVHSLPEEDSGKSIDFTIVVQTVAENLDAVEKVMNQASKSLDSKKESKFVEDVRNLFSEVEVIRIGNNVVLGSGQVKSQEFLGRLRNRDLKIRSLQKSRSYQAIQSILGAREKAQIRGFVNPRLAGRWVAQFVDSKMESIPPKELAGAGFKISLDSEDPIQTPGGKYRLAAEIEVAVRFTEPASGFGKIIQAYRDIKPEIELPFDIALLSAVDFDAGELFKARSELYATSNPNDTWEERVMNRYAKYGFNTQQFLGSSRGRVKLYTTAGELVMFEKTNQDADMEKVFEGHIHDENRRTPKNARLTKVEDCPYGNYFTRTESALKNFRKFGNIVGEVDKRAMDSQWIYFQNEQWMVRGMKKSIEFLFSEHFENPSKKPNKFNLLLENTIDKMRHGPYFGIEYSSDNWWISRAYRFESARIKQKYETYPERNEVLFSEPRSNLLRNKFESEKDSVAGFKTLVARAIAESFGTSCFLFSKTDRHMHIRGRVYSKQD